MLRHSPPGSGLSPWDAMPWLRASLEVDAIPAEILPAAQRLWESQHRCSIWTCPLVRARGSR